MTSGAQSSGTSISETAREDDDRAIGIDVGGTHLRAALISGRGGVLRRIVEPTPTSPEDALDTAARMARQILESCPEEITSLGIAVGATLAGAQVSWSSQPALDNEHIGTHLAEATGLHVTLINDARAAALAEARVGAGVGLPSTLMITVGTGFGGGIVIGGRVFQGTDNAGEVGHVVIDPNGPPCRCGHRGCWERLAGGWAIDAAARAEARSRPFGLTARVAAPDAPTATHLARAAEQGDSDANVIIGGGVMARRGAVANAYLAAAASLRWNRGDVVRSDLGDDGGMIGAAIHALDGRCARRPRCAFHPQPSKEEPCRTAPGGMNASDTRSTCHLFRTRMATGGATLRALNNA